MIALSRHDDRARAHLRAARRRGIEVSVPAVVVAETIRRRADDAPVNRVLKAIKELTETTPDDGRTAGQLLGRHNSDATIDALVVASTERLGGGVVLTGDTNDMAVLAQGLDSVTIQPL